MKYVRGGVVVAIASLMALAGLPAAQARPAASTVTGVAHGQDSRSESAAAKEQKQAVLNLLAAYGSGDQAAFDVISPKNFVQHDPEIADGVSGLKAWLASIPKGQISVRPVRVLVDGPYVVVHSETKLPTGDTVSLDIFRFEKGKIVEHWDARQAMTPANGAGHTELDGPTKVTGLGRTQANKALAWTAMTKVFEQGDLSQFGEPIWKADTYIQHNVGINSDGTAGSKAILVPLVESGDLNYVKIAKVLGEGNFVLVVGESYLYGKPSPTFDLFRMDKGQIVEHWDVLPTLTPVDQAKNSNGDQAKNSNGLYDFPQDPLAPGVS